MAPPVKGLYFLLRDGVVVYVGRSIDCMRRIITHDKDPLKSFDSYSVFPIDDDEELGLAEAENIFLYCPEQNSSIPTGSRFISAQMAKKRYGINAREIKVMASSGDVGCKEFRGIVYYDSNALI